ncbi:LPS-assembly protein LptD [Legionella sp. W05-934-2]|uniref:LPS-assembly protein LptD n=1 Tax=Legionella sp. W05-934-2 TaxID=1198649 RepID=UPI003462D8E4
MKIVKLRKIKTDKDYWRRFTLMLFAIVTLLAGILAKSGFAGMAGGAPVSVVANETIKACVWLSNPALTTSERQQIARCLHWQTEPYGICPGRYTPLPIVNLPPGKIEIQANHVSFASAGESKLQGDVQVEQSDRVVTADTAYIYRNKRTNQVDKIILLNHVTYREPDRLMLANRATIFVSSRSGIVEQVLYRFNLNRIAAVLPAWGRAKKVIRKGNKDLILHDATYTTCAPTDNAWEIQANKISLDNTKHKGVARQARLRVKDKTVAYFPYLSFPTSNDRQSGFLIPIKGYTNLGGYDLAIPYYWNIAPNYDATIVPHIYTLRGLMIGGEFRYLNDYSRSYITGNILPNDRAFKKFKNDNINTYQGLRFDSDTRWNGTVRNNTLITPNLRFHLDVNQVSDDYYLEDFNSNLSMATARQLLRQADLTYNTEHWLWRTAIQSYQTLNPFNQTPINLIYQRLPQLLGQGHYGDLPLDSMLDVNAQFDYFVWPDRSRKTVEGGRTYFNPVWTVPFNQTWGYIRPTFDAVQRNYQLANSPMPIDNKISSTIGRAGVDGGLFFDRYYDAYGQSWMQTIEPRLYYLYVPAQDQSAIPVFDSGNMIFTYNQLFRINRFSGNDRIGDANQLSYALSTRFINQGTGTEVAQLSAGQIRYFRNRTVPLCYPGDIDCINNQQALGFLDPTSRNSPAVVRGVVRLMSRLSMTGDYAWDPATRSTDNTHINMHYEMGVNQLFNIGYTYLVNGDTTQIANGLPQNNALNQISTSFAWPLTDYWSVLGAYSFNLSKHYEMMSLAGVQYDSCCWAFRVTAGRNFYSLNQQLRPQYNNNVYFQILFKGLGSLATSDPTGAIQTYVLGYQDLFRSAQLR